jgi:hypothetical protein
MVYSDDNTKSIFMDFKNLFSYRYKVSKKYEIYKNYWGKLILQSDLFILYIPYNKV